MESNQGREKAQKHGDKMYDSMSPRFCDKSCVFFSSRKVSNPTRIVETIVGFHNRVHNDINLSEPDNLSTFFSKSHQVHFQQDVVKITNSANCSEPQTIRHSQLSS